MLTCNRLDLQTLGSQPVMPKNLPNHCSQGTYKMGEERSADMVRSIFLIRTLYLTRGVWLQEWIPKTHGFIRE